jgi:Uma2 family endonuclease
MTTTAAAPPVAERRVLMRGISWETYESLVRELEGQHLRLTYDQGLLEIAPPSLKHCRIGKLVARIVEAYTLEQNIPLAGFGNATWKSEALQKGVEPDECYYVQHAEWAAGREEFDLNVDPPPDLAIEVDITSSSLNKQQIYADLGVPELWRHEDERLEVLLLNKPMKTYVASPTSASLPDLLPEVIDRFVAMRKTGATDTRILAEFVRWVRGGTAQP